MNKVKTYIEEFDKLISGGFYPNSANLIIGKTGTGKSSFCISFAYYGAKNNEPCVYVSTEESIEDIKKDAMEVFNWNLEELEKENLLKFISFRRELPTEITEGDEKRIIRLYISDIIRQITNAVIEINARRIVFDSISTLELFIRDKYLARNIIMDLIDKLKELNVTSLLTGTIPEEGEKLSTLGIIEFLVDGIIKLDFVPVVEKFKRTLTIRKMRRVNHSTLIHPFEITREGIKILEIK